jgi:hypothetical protein
LLRKCKTIQLLASLVYFTMTVSSEGGGAEQGKWLISPVSKRDALTPMYARDALQPETWAGARRTGGQKELLEERGWHF